MTVRMHYGPPECAGPWRNDWGASQRWSGNIKSLVSCMIWAVQDWIDNFSVGSGPGLARKAFRRGRVNGEPLTH
jgi:hypothetical protein